ncbi:glycosyltransferase family 39 protein [Desulfosporosinus sp. FKB]|uniref:glycosyltransferase 87 family protein n=1 Tax=Desulfosporosinus sp. FKB TaxID=1969835 RepID=UPI001FA8B853|nr:glycosyltransferase family 39 protein [Desulfosporosinus sp. FKB]
MLPVKRSLFRLSAVLIIAASFFLCFYAVVHHNSNTASTGRVFSQNQSQSVQTPQFSGQPADQGQNQIRPHENGVQASPNGQFNSNGRSFNRGTFPGPGRRSNAGNSFTVQVVAYTVLFFLAALVSFFILKSSPKYKEILAKLLIDRSNQRIIMVTLICAGLLLRIALGILIEGHPFDLNTFKSWAALAANNFSQFYVGRHASDYPPLYIYILYLIGKIGSLKAMSAYYTILLKLPSILADIITALLLFKLARKYLSAELSTMVAAFYIFNPAVLVNSTIWGQVDSFFTLLIVTAVVLLMERKLVYAAIFFTASVLMKPQGIIFLPILFFELVRQKSLKSIGKVLISGLLTAVTIILPFSLQQNPLWIVKLFTSTLGEYPYASVNAFNFFYLLGANYKKDTLPFLFLNYHSWGLIFIVLVTLLAWFVFAKSKKESFLSVSALILISGVFLFSASMHERYLFPAAALALLAFIYTKDKRFMLLSIGVSVTGFVNTYLILCQTNEGINQAAFSTIPVMTSILNLCLFLYLIKIVCGKNIYD